MNAKFVFDFFLTNESRVFHKKFKASSTEKILLNYNRVLWHLDRDKIEAKRKRSEKMKNLTDWISRQKVERKRKTEQKWLEVESWRHKINKNKIERSKTRRNKNEKWIERSKTKNETKTNRIQALEDENRSKEKKTADVSSRKYTNDDEMKRKKEVERKEEVFYKRKSLSKNSDKRVIHNDDTYYSRHELTSHFIFHFTTHLTFHFTDVLTSLMFSLHFSSRAAKIKNRTRFVQVSITYINFIHENMSFWRKRILLRSRFTR